MFKTSIFLNVYIFECSVNVQKTFFFLIFIFIVFLFFGFVNVNENIKGMFRFIILQTGNVLLNVLWTI